MSNVPEEFDHVLYWHGIGEGKALFMIEFPDGVDDVRFSAIGRDDDGVYLETDEGDRSRIMGEVILEAFDELEDCDVVRLHVLDERGGRDYEYDIARLAPVNSHAYGA